MNKVMLRFKHELLSWADHIRRVAYLERLEVVDQEHGEFTLVAHWKGGKEEQRFTRQLVLGKYIARPPLQQQPHQRVCRFRDDFIRRVLHARGIG
jgi:hypothetical protein